MKNRYISAAVQPISTKFGKMMHFEPLDHPDRKKFKILQIQDGGGRHFKMAAAAIFDFRNFKFLTGLEGRTASSCQISSKSRKPRLRYGHFTIFKMAAAAILDLQNFKFDGLEVRNASSCQISSISVKPRPRNDDFSIFLDGGHRHLGFLKFQMFI